jgi:hypothetical protein
MAEHFAIAVPIDNFVLVSPLLQSRRPTLVRNMLGSNQSIDIATNSLWTTVKRHMTAVVVEKPFFPA